MRGLITWSSPILRVLFVAVLTSASVEVRADFRMLQHFSSGRQTSGFNSVQCSDPNGFAHWNKRSISIRHNTSNQGSGKATALQAAMQAWTNVPDTSYVLSYAGTTSAGFVTDAKNTMVWIANGPCVSPCLGLTALVLQQPGQVIVESDVVFNNGIAWNTNGSDYDTQGVATHEMGHMLGIFHSTCINGPGTMCSGYGGSDWRSLEFEDKQALQCSENRYCPPGAVPAPPLTLEVISDSCYGHNDLVWSRSCEGITRYELYRSLSSTFSSQTLEYSGLNQSHHVSVSQTTYFRVRACNANGCGAYRVADSPAKVAPGCW